MKKSKKELVIKPNKLIQKASFDFTELQLKNINYVIAKIIENTNINENEYIELDIKDICIKMGITPKGDNYRIIRESFFDLESKRKAIKINNNGDILNFAFIMKAIGNDNTGKMYIKVMNEMVEMVKNYMLEKQFTIFELCNTFKLKRKYSIRLYELCKSWQNNKIVYNGKQFNGFIFDIEKSKENWKIPNSYPYGMYKKQIIDTAVKEINEKTDIKIKIIDKIKEVKKIKSFIIEIEQNKKETETKEEPIKSQTKAKVKPNGRQRTYKKGELEQVYTNLDNIEL